jgi:site-specific recombinase XerD
MTKLTQREAEDKLIHFIITNKEEGMSWGALHNYVSAVAKFYLVNDITLNLNRVKRFMPEQTRLRKDRPYKPEEIQQLIQLSTERNSALILLLCSSGMRVGGAAGLKYADLEDKGDIYKITVYADTKQEYYTFCTPEAKKA